MRPVQVPIHAVGIPLAGFVFDRTGTYAIAYQVFLVTYVVAIAGVVVLGRGRAKAP